MPGILGAQQQQEDLTEEWKIPKLKKETEETSLLLYINIFLYFGTTLMKEVILGVNVLYLFVLDPFPQSLSFIPTFWDKQREIGRHVTEMALQRLIRLTDDQNKGRRSSYTICWIVIVGRQLSCRPADCQDSHCSTLSGRCYVSLADL